MSTTPIYDQLANPATTPAALTPEDEARAAIVALLQYVAAVVLFVAGAIVTGLWLTNLGPVYLWHFAGLPLLAGSFALMVRVSRGGAR